MEDDRMRRYYDAAGKRLVFVGDTPDSGYWDEHWPARAVRKLVSLTASWFAGHMYLLVMRKR